MHMHVQSIRLVNAGLFLASAGDSEPASIQSPSDALGRLEGLAASNARTTGVACVKHEHRMKSRVRKIGCIAASSARVAESSSSRRHRHGGRCPRGESCEYPIASRRPGPLWGRCAQIFYSNVFLSRDVYANDSEVISEN